MARLIDADSLFKTIEQNDYYVMSPENNVDKGMLTTGIKQAIDEQPTIDAAPIVRAHWEDCDLTDGKDMVAGGYKRCSNCHGFGFIHENWYGDLTDQCLTDYCPDCGARISS